MALATAPAGRFEGLDHGDVHAFLGIPYAQAPIGALRFRPPQPRPSEAGVRPATHYGPSSPQRPDEPGIPYMPLAVGATDEDCLYLNLWTPATDGAARPVLFWVHGGGFCAGSGSEPFYDGTVLAREQDVVVVTVNYRLGALGGLVDFSATGEADLDESANLAILDIALALRWVSENIAAFGGDPNCVTLAGQSAGGKLVAAVATMDATKGLFHRLILQSPSSYALLERGETALVAREFLTEVAREYDGPIAKAPADALYRAAAPISTAHSMGPLGPPIAPFIDGTVLTAQPLDRIRDGLIADIPILAGTTTHEMEMLLRSVGMDAAGIDAVSQFAATLPSPTLARIVAAYAPAALEGLTPGAPASLALYLADRTMRMDVIRLLEVQSRHQPHCFAYMLQWPTLIGGGAAHCIDYPFLFGTVEAPDLPALIANDAHFAAASRRFRDRWAAFMRTGVPNLEGVTPWPAFDAIDRGTMIIAPQDHVIDDPWGAQRAAWTDIESPGGPLLFEHMDEPVAGDM